MTTFGFEIFDKQYPLYSLILWKNGNHSVVAADAVREGENGHEVKWAGEWKQFETLIIPDCSKKTLLQFFLKFS